MKNLEYRIRNNTEKSKLQSFIDGENHRPAASH
jgi:hypothetical protein